MPPSSAVKHARKHANKLKPSASTAQTPEIVSPPTQSTDSTPALALPPSTVIDFETFVELADLDDILQFCKAAASTREGRNLKLRWDRAFEAGLDQGWNEERDYRDEMYLRGKVQGMKGRSCQS